MRAISGRIAGAAVAPALLTLAVLAAVPPTAAWSQPAATSLEVVAELTQPPGNIAVTPDGRIIISQHQFYAPTFRVVEVLGDGTTRPFPNERWSGPLGPDGVIGLGAVLGIRSDADGVVWMLDNGSRPPRIVAWDTRADGLQRIIPLPPPASVEGSFHNDLAVDPLNRAIYIADFGDGPRAGAIVVVDLQTGEARRVLQGAAATSAEEGVAMVIEGRRLQMKKPDGSLVEPRVAVNPITIDSSSTWVYFGPMTGHGLYRVRTSDLRDASLSDAQLEARIERWADKPISDGISIDDDGNVYVTDIAASSIGVVLAADRSYRTLARDTEKLSWPDAISTAPDGYMYVAVNKLHLSAPLNGGVNASEPPYYIVRFPPLASVTVGR